jgi:hypothetical protein
MLYGFGTYEFLANVVPGGLFLFFLMLLFPNIRTVFGRARMDVGGLGLFLIVSFVLGQSIQSLSFFIIEKPMVALNLARRIQYDSLKSDYIIKIQQQAAKEFNLPPPEQWKADYDKNWHTLIRRIHSKINQQNLSDRLEIYSRQFAVSMTLAGVFALALVICTMVFLMQRFCVDTFISIKVAFMPPILKGIALSIILLGLVLELLRMSYFDVLFKGELLSTYSSQQSTVNAPPPK